jgi:peroxiredoxin
VNPITPLMPRQPVPPLEVPMAGGGVWRLADEKPQLFTMIAFYRGQHCKVCSDYLAILDKKLSKFTERGVTAIAISADPQERAEATKLAWKLENLRIGYGLDMESARRWGLYITAGRYITRNGLAEPTLFSEPALYLIHPDGNLYFGSVQTMPFARPGWNEVLYAIDFAVEKNYPSGGNVVDHKAVLAEVAEHGEVPRERLHRET